MDEDEYHVTANCYLCCVGSLRHAKIYFLQNSIRITAVVKDARVLISDLKLGEGFIALE
jgi:hypothetical protein